MASLPGIVTPSHHAQYHLSWGRPPRYPHSPTNPTLCAPTRPSVSLSSLDATARIEAERTVAEDSGFSTLSRLDEQLLATSSRLDQAKKKLYFPEAKGYRRGCGEGACVTWLLGMDTAFTKERASSLARLDNNVFFPSGTSFL